MLDKQVTKIKMVAYFKLLSAIGLWAGVYHVAKFLVGDVDIYTIAFLRFLISSIVLLPIYLTKRGKPGIKLIKNNWLFLAIIGFFGSFLYNIFFLSAETYVSADDVALLYAFTPCITIIIGCVVFKQKINRNCIFGILVALFGTIGVINENSILCGKYFCANIINGGFSIGQQLALLATLTMAIYNVLNKKALMSNLDSVTIVTGSSFFGMVFSFITFLINSNHKAVILHMPFSFWWAMFYISVLSTIIGYKWYSDAIHHIGILQTVVFQNTLPFITILIGMFFLGESIKLQVFIFGIIIALGVIITNYAILDTNKYHPKD